MRILVLAFCIGCVIGTLDAQNQTSESEENGLHSRVKRVVNGDEIGHMGHWPWLVHIWAKTREWRVFDWSTTTYYCGGSIIADRWILSAAHCFKQGPGNDLMKRRKWHVRSGERQWECDFMDKLKHVFCRIFNIARCRCHIHNEKIFIHPEYNADNLWENDIALIKLETGILSRRRTAAIDLPTAATGITWPREGTTCVAKGWGCTNAGGPITTRARKVTLPVFPNGRCATHYSGAADPLDTSSRMCAFQYGSSICSGDSGGPLVCKNDANRWIQAGITSFAASRYPQYSPSVFTRVSHYSLWIQSIINNN